jgi:hypothetical protein
VFIRHLIREVEIVENAIDFALVNTIHEVVETDVAMQDAWDFIKPFVAYSINLGSVAFQRNDETAQTLKNASNSLRKVLGVGKLSNRKELAKHHGPELSWFTLASKFHPLVVGIATQDKRQMVGNTIFVFFGGGESPSPFYKLVLRHPSHCRPAELHHCLDALV